ncbi:MAG: CRISPR system precrRNA processing endoribonuclease RAMP protein Cas6 [Candidatus Sumerlaeaceae bacterium]|nr:CRISPR system precrRNA processing endoribonuclease RAMP protein Cas6 [Candidatus Sumerlaeaceae bacterium]
MSVSQTGHGSSPAVEGNDLLVPVLRVAAVELLCVVHKPVVWGNFPPSVIHGMLGMVWRGGLCFKPTNPSCATCEVLSRCSYGLCFAGCIPAGSETPKTAGVHQLPAVRLFLDRWQDNFLEVGAFFRLQLWCYGKAADKASIILASLFHALDYPTGRTTKQGQRGEIYIASARDLMGETTWHHPAQKGSALPQLKVKSLNLGFVFSLTAAPQSPLLEGPWRLTTLSPVRLEERGKPLREITPRAFATAIVRRLSALTQIHEGLHLNANYRYLGDIADSLNYVAVAAPRSQTRYSARQGQQIEMSGLQGYMEIGALPKAWKQLFSIAQIIGIGKATSMGFGAVRLDRIGNSRVA